MSRRKMGNPQKSSKFICCKCLTENQMGAGIQRIQQREKGHIKDLTCLKCNKITKNVEIRYCETFEEMLREAKKVHLQEYSKEDITIYQNMDICNLNDLYQDSIYFKPLKEQNSLIQYGAALIEYKIPAKYIEESIQKENYIEYILKEDIEPEFIKAIYIPEIFESRITVRNYVYKKIKWCQIKGFCDYESGTYECSKDRMCRLGKTAALNSYEKNYFKGKNKDKTEIELHDIIYII